MNALSVSQVNGYVKALLDRDEILDDITIAGEISNFKRHSSGHWYFSLKDEGSVLNGAMFRGANRSVDFLPDNGMKVLVHGKISVYVPSGNYQIIADKMMPDGIGALYEAFEKLKGKLEKEGLFDKSFKKSIPDYPMKIGVVTSPTGAAIRDIISVTGRRWPLAEIVIAPVLVQGSQAPASIMKAIEEINAHNACDVIILGRGGGSIEDLWAFNDEGVARAVFASKIPIVSAVGHETDYTISDFVADVRAATPSAAAELVTPDISEMLSYTRQWSVVNRMTIENKIKMLKNRLELITNTPVMKRPEAFIEMCAQRLDNIIYQLNNNFSAVLSQKREQLSKTTARLEALDPKGVLSRGYGIVYKDKIPVSSVSVLNENDIIDIQFYDGKISAKIISEAEESNG